MDIFNSIVSALFNLSILFLMTIQGLFTSFEFYIAPSPAPMQKETVSAAADNVIIATSTATSSKNIFPTAPTHATTTVKKTTNTASVVLQKTISPQPAVSSPTPSIDAEILNIQTRAAVVNILCTTNVGGTDRYISGSGVMVDTRGVILTNAHVAQFFLLNDYPAPNGAACVIRTGSPAQPQYHAKLLYLPPSWVMANASQLTTEHAVGTGEGDYAFLLITSTTNLNGTLPTSFPSLPMTNAWPDVGNPVLLTAYPAGFLDSITIEKNLYVTSAFTNIQTLFTFDDILRVDLISVKGTVVSQGGSSGGAVVSAQNGKLQALIVTDTDAATTAQRELRAMTLSYIDRNLQSDGKGGITGLLSVDLGKEVAVFAASTGAIEKANLINALTHH